PPVLPVVEPDPMQDGPGPDGLEEVATLCEGQSLSFDEMFRLLLDDLRQIDLDDRVFIRYLSLMSRFNAGVCSADLAVDRQALAEVVNLLSINSRIVLPQAINSDETLYRIDLRDYDWDRAVTVANTDSVTDYVDVWEAIADVSPFSMPFVGVTAESVTAQTNTLFSFMDAAALIDIASTGSLYYAAIGVDSTRSLDDFLQNGLGLVGTSLQATDSVWAGIEQSRISRGPQLATRRQLGVREGYVWESRSARDEGASLLANPLALPLGEASVIFSLPNKLWGFVVADPTGAVAFDATVLDVNQNNFRAISAISCLDCHSQGLVPIVDEVLPFVVANRTSFDQQTFADVQSKFVTNAELERLMNGDNAERREALDALSIPAGSRDPVSQVYLAFDRDLDLARAAGELGVSAALLRQKLPELGSPLGVLSSSTLDRDDFAVAFRSALCALPPGAVNRPDPAFCP
ncbi:MAG TPA: hypothetical protein VJU61_02400, partial [Polyangiaceae bacterium]|nr:hypothetical protein [Polyangiaceae bacterium]